MKKILIVLATLVLIGCSSASNTVSPVIEGWAFADDKVMPVLYGTDADTDGADEYHIAAYDWSAGTYSRNTIGTDDFLQGQWAAQRNSIVYMTDGQWGIVAIEDTSIDLELWFAENASYDISGTWTLVDDEALSGGCVDGISYQNGIHVATNADTFASIFPDEAGTWVEYGGEGGTTTGITATLDKQLTGWIFEYGTGNQFQIAHDYTYSKSAGGYGTFESDDKIITDDAGCIWLFNPDSTTLDVAVLDDIYSIMLEDDTSLTGINENIITLTPPAGHDYEIIDYDCVTNFLDNTIHLVTIERDYYEDESLGTSYDIVGGWSGIGGYWLADGDCTAEIGFGDTIRVTGTTGNDGDYTVGNVPAYDPMNDWTQLNTDTIPNPVLAEGSLAEVLTVDVYDYDLNYYRRDGYGWSDSVTIDSWTFNFGTTYNEDAFDLQELGTFPQISVGSVVGSPMICVYYLEAIPAATSHRDVRRMFLSTADYGGYATPANWDQTTNIDNDTEDVRFCLTIGNHPDF